ncbi:50S ribosomal protein L14e [Candidatus Woesearchaeota archaeon]|nr:50S ribosomal protein L14e [Candidatus Woesearchaeota archaeon]
MIEIGRLCIKTAGRDAGLKCVVVDILDNRFVLIDGETRRRKCNILHLEPLEQTVKIKKKCSHEEVSKALKAIGIIARETKPKQKTEKPRKKENTSEEPKGKKEGKKKEKKKLGKALKPKRKGEAGKEKAEEGGESLEEKAGLAKDAKKKGGKETKRTRKAPKK